MLQGALADFKTVVAGSVKDAVARLPAPQHISQPTCCAAAQQELQELQQLQSCVVCMDAPRSVLLLPCKHLVLCEKCCQAMQQPAQRRGRSAARHLKPVECPVCRQRAEEQVAGVILS
uniref:RING-type domain-containing protein n=1 Tax=Tetradesmus obliquus TaxID=3088 RepID=A0A383WB55_TETOB|eukprot:jgi/Sobl393_1/6678/SZX74473.1